MCLFPRFLLLYVPLSPLSCLPIVLCSLLFQVPCLRCLQNSVACIIFQKTGQHLACSLCTVGEFKCEPSAAPSSSCPPRMPAIPSLPSNAPAATPKSDSPAHPGLSTPRGHLLPKVIIPLLTSMLGRHRSSSHHTSQEVNKLPKSPVLVKRHKVKSRAKLPSSSPLPCSPSLPSLPNIADYLVVPRHTMTKTLTQPVLGRAPHTELVYPKLVVPGTIIDHTPQYSSRERPSGNLMLTRSQ